MDFITWSIILALSVRSEANYWDIGPLQILASSSSSFFLSFFFFPFFFLVGYEFDFINFKIFIEILCFKFM